MLERIENVNEQVIKKMFLLYAESMADMEGEFKNRDEMEASKWTSMASSGFGSSHTLPPGSQLSGSSVCQPSSRICLKIPYS